MRFVAIYGHFCYVCLSYLCETEDANLNGIQIKDDWKNYSEDNPTLLSCKDSDLENKYQPGSASDSLTRLIFWDPLKKEFHISGIFKRLLEMVGEVSSVPWNTNLAVVAGQHDNNINHEVNIITAKNPKQYEWLYSDLIDNTEKEGVPYGFPVHFSCWILVRRFIGPQAEMNLESFVKILSKRVKQPLGGEFYRWMNTGSLPLSIVAFYIHLVNDKIDIEWTFSDSTKFRPLRTLIKKSIWRKRNKAQPREAKSKLCRIQRHRLIRLPVEIQYMILDFLTTDEIQKLRQFLEWQIPYIYWMSRIRPRGMIWELQEDDGCYKEVCEMGLFLSPTRKIVAE